MKLIKLSFVIAVAVMAICGISATSYAFHAGGVASCESCHTMHNSYTGLAMTGMGSTTAGPAAGVPGNSAKFLLRGTDQSSTCLNCHENPAAGSYHISTPNANLVNAAPINMTPGGDFGWLRAATSTSATTERRGHNIVAADFGYTVDSTNTAAPGGTYLASNLSCISCHNPHNQLRRTDDTNTWIKPAIGTSVAAIASSGSYLTSVPTSTQAVGPYRFLRSNGADQAPKSTGFVFNNPVPDAAAPGTYNRSEATVDTHVAYGAGMSQWCANCHTAMYDPAGDSGIGNSGHPHPTNKLLSDDGEDLLYNAYVGSGNLTGDGATKGGYLSLVPVEISGAAVDYSVLRAAGSSDGSKDHLVLPATAKVMCLSCHRAHATGFNSMTRFGIGDFAMTDANAANYVVPPAGAGGMSTAAQVLQAYYQRNPAQFSANNKTLCNKCHAKD